MEQNIEALLDLPIDFRAIIELDQKMNNRTRVGVRLFRFLKKQGIVNYRKLVELAEASKVKIREERAGVYPTFTMPRQPFEEGFRKLMIVKGIGINNLELIYSHLDSVGINLFEDGYRPSESYFKRQDSS